MPTHPQEDAGNFWHLRNCKDMDPEWFFPQKDQKSMWYSNRESKAAMKACRECPIRMACLEYAIVNVCEGIWGGTTKAQRMQIRERAHQAGTPYEWKPFDASDYLPLPSNRGVESIGA